MAHLTQQLRHAMEQGAARAKVEQLAARTLAVARLDVNEQVFAGADSDGCYALAIAAKSADVSPAPISMAALSVEFGTRYLLDQQGAHDEVRVTVLRCNSLDPEIRELFGSFCDALLAAVPSHPHEEELAVELDKWLGLFWRLRAPSNADVIGLIGELTLLRVAPNPSEWVRAWHGDPTSTVDFVIAHPPMEVEVKATQSANRTHTLSAGQAFGVGNRYFASVTVDLRDSGDTIGNFARAIVEDLELADDRQRFWNNLAAECGSAFAQLMAERFVWQQSIDSIAFFKRDDVPRPEVAFPLPAAVTRLRFTSDFSSTPSTSAGEFFESLADAAPQV